MKRAKLSRCSAATQGNVGANLAPVCQSSACCGQFRSLEITNGRNYSMLAYYISMSLHDEILLDPLDSELGDKYEIS